MSAGRRRSPLPQIHSINIRKFEPNRPQARDGRALAATTFGANSRCNVRLPYLLPIKGNPATDSSAPQRIALAELVWYLRLGGAPLYRRVDEQGASGEPRLHLLLQRRLQRCPLCGARRSISRTPSSHSRTVIADTKSSATSTLPAQAVTFAPASPSRALRFGRHSWYPEPVS